MKWWHWFNRTEGGYEKYGTGYVQAIIVGTAIFAGFFSIMGWL